MIGPQPLQLTASTVGGDGGGAATEAAVAKVAKTVGDAFFAKAAIPSVVLGGE